MVGQLPSDSEIFHFVYVFICLCVSVLCAMCVPIHVPMCMHLGQERTSGVLPYQFVYSFKTVSLTEPGARLTTRLTPLPPSSGLIACAAGDLNSGPQACSLCKHKNSDIFVSSF